MAGDQPKTREVDVVVVGAGASGIPAAVASARRGAKTLVLEKRCQVGGMLRDGLGFPLCGLFATEPPDSPRLLNKGLAAELAERVIAENPEAIDPMGRVYVLQCRTKQWQKIYQHWIDAEPNLQLLTQVSSLHVEEQDQRITALRCHSADGQSMHIVAGAFVDCSGDGIILQQSSAESIVPKHPALAGFSLRLCHVVPGELLSVKVPYVLRKAAEAGLLPMTCCFTVFSFDSPGCGVCKMSVPAGSDLTTVVRWAHQLVEVLRMELPEFERAQWVERSPRVMPREGVRLKGEVVITGADVLSGRKVDDAVARGCWPIERWDRTTGPHYQYLPRGSAYEIPMRALRSVNIENLWVAGRLLSSDSDALASVRVIGTAMTTGEAAGRAAAESVL